MGDGDDAVLFLLLLNRWDFLVDSQCMPDCLHDQFNVSNIALVACLELCVGLLFIFLIVIVKIVLSIFPGFKRTDDHTY